MSLQDYLASRGDRCPGCLAHVETQGCHCPGGEWEVFVRAVRAAADETGLVSQNRVRPLIRGRIEAKHVGPLYRRARSLKLIEDTGEREPSTDAAGRNTDKQCRIYRLRSAA